MKRDRAALVKALRASGPEGQKLRMAWHRLQVDDLVATAKEVSAAVAAVSPETRIGLCAPGGFPERETAEIARALAGKHRPVVRWYGSFYGYDFPVQTSGRLFSAQWARENLSPEIEYLYEADVIDVPSGYVRRVDGGAHLDYACLRLLPAALPGAPEP